MRRALSCHCSRARKLSSLFRWAATLKEVLLREERWLSVEVGTDPGTDGWPGQPVRDLEIPPGCLLALVRRNGHSLVPGGGTVVEEGDHLTFIGDPEAIALLAKRTGHDRTETPVAGGA